VIRRLLVVLLLLAAPACSGSDGGGTTKGEVLVVVSAPLTAQPWIGRFAERGAKLAAQELNASGGADGRKVVVDVLDNGGSPQQAVKNARTAVAKHALALIIDGVGAIATADITDPASLPVFIVFEGGASLVDAKERPTLFRMAPANKPMATRLPPVVSSRLSTPSMERLLLRPRIPPKLKPLSVAALRMAELERCAFDPADDATPGAVRTMLR